MEASTYKTLLIVFCTAFLISTRCYGDLGHTNPNHVALFIFGDSLYDPGNNNYINTTAEFQANFTPYGESFFKNPTGRFSDGRLICDFIAEYAKLPLIPAYSKPGNHEFEYGANFASGGAGALVESNRGWVIDLETQLSYFQNVKKMLKNKLGDAEVEELLSRAVYLFSAGGNDYISPLVRNQAILESYTRSQYLDIVIGNFTSAIKEVYKLGGRKFGFLSLMPLGCIPSLKAIKPVDEDGECHKEATLLTNLHNKAFPEVLQKLERQLKGFKYAFSDLHTFISDRISHPSRYGFKEGKIACCGSGVYNGIYSCGGKRGVKEYELCSKPDEYLFFDSSHPSEKTYQQFAELYWRGTGNDTTPYTLEELFEHQCREGFTAL